MLCRHVHFDILIDMGLVMPFFPSHKRDFTDSAMATPNRRRSNDCRLDKLVVCLIVVLTFGMQQALA